MSLKSFNPDAAATGGGIFGLPHSAEDATIILVPVPFAATVSYGQGADQGPEIIREASKQVDLFDLQTGRPWEHGIHMLPADPRILEAHKNAATLARPIIAAGGAQEGDEDKVAEVNAAGELVNTLVYAATAEILKQGRIPGIVGGDHSVPFGAIRAGAERYPGMGILHIDAHADLRSAYEGFQWSHASIMDNVLRELDGVARIVQVGIRDLCEEELDRIKTSKGRKGRLVTHFDQDWHRDRFFTGIIFDALCQVAIKKLPKNVWVSFDIDGLDPTLCPGTGTPVPGGLQFAEVCHLLECLVNSGRKIIGFDLVEVAGGEWDANVGARILYKLCGFALMTR